MSAPVTAEGDTPPAVMPQRQRLVISSAGWKEPAALSVLPGGLRLRRRNRPGPTPGKLSLNTLSRSPEPWVLC